MSLVTVALSGTFLSGNHLMESHWYYSKANEA